MKQSTRYILRYAQQHYGQDRAKGDNIPFTTLSIASYRNIHYVNIMQMTKKGRKEFYELMGRVLTPA